MNGPDTFEQELLKLVREDKHYPIQAYYFIYEALDFAQKRLGRSGHVNGTELALCIREMAIEQFGMLAITVFNDWKVYKTDDFGELVFKLIEVDLLKKTPDDKKEDFFDVYDFDEAFAPEVIESAAHD
ncbi:MAG: hypothetical protein O3B01_32300 [Planctomycetota bacterium]|nr:hypothetical protein [Planctomycetota bacterium]MDA1143264.1 hypothetical protein [Planctomycetota bacterium]